MDMTALALARPRDAAQWERLLAAAPASLWQQGWAYGAAAARAGRRVERVVVTVMDQPVGLAQLVGRTALGGRIGAWSALGGPVWLPGVTAATATAALVALKRRFAAPGHVLVVTPGPTPPALAASLDEAGLRRVMTGYTTALLPIEADAAAQDARLQPSWRHLIRRGPRPELTIDVLKPAAAPLALAEALARHEAMRRRRGFQAVADSLVAHAAKHGDARLVRGHVDGELCAFVLLLRHGAAATYQCGWTDAVGRRLAAHRHLLWTGLASLRREGTRLLDLGGLNVPDGIAAFKLGSGAQPVTLAGSFL